MFNEEAADRGIRKLVNDIAAIDDHAHPMPAAWELLPEDPGHPITPYDHPLPVRMRPTNPEYLDAWQALWGYEHDDVDPDHVAALVESKQQVQASQGAEYPNWVLDQLNIETMLAVDTARQPAFLPPRFRWVAHTDWLMWPVPAVDQHPITGGYSALLDAACADLGVPNPAATVQSYVDEVLRPIIDRMRSDGAVSLKFHTPYYRPINFGAVPLSVAQAIYERALGEGVSSAQHRELEDYLFAEIARKAGEVGLPVQMHTGQGPRQHFENAGSNPLLMESAVVAAPDTQFLMLHAGWPFDREAVASLAHDNVYLDISGSTVHLYARNLASILRDGLEWFPEKVLYGTDAYSDTAHAFLSSTEPRSNFLQGWEEKAWLLDRTARDALALALTDMRGDHVIAANDVERLATMVLRENALRLYPL